MVICWLTGYGEQDLQAQIDKGVDFETFFAEAPQINPNAAKIKRSSLRGSGRGNRRPANAENHGGLTNWLTNWQKASQWRRF